MQGSANAALLSWGFDENGNGGAPGLSLSHQEAPDSNTGITTLDYLWPLNPPAAGYTLAQGWVAIYEDGAQSHLSDLIHFGGFVGSGQNNSFQQIFYYSSHNNGSLADHWLTTPQIDAIFTGSSLVKISQNSAGVATYTPVDAQPGYFTGQNVPSDFGYTYTFVSSVPEPGVYGAFAGGLGLLCLGSCRWWRGRQKYGCSILRAAC